MNHPPITYRCFEPRDIEEILRIQNDNLLANLSRTEKADGFLSVAFPPQQFSEMHHDIPIVVADTGSQLGGYLCGSSLAYSKKIPLMAHMVGLFKDTTYKHRPLEAYRSFFYGPVCIDRPFRGRGMINGLFTEQMHQLAGKFDVGALFVSCDNPRSLQAHTHHLGMKRLRTFEFNGNDFYLLAFDVPAR